MKKIMTVLTIAVATLALVACGGGSEKKNVTPEELAQLLATQITYTGEMEQVEADELDWYVDLEEGVTGVAYEVSGVSCEQVAVFQTPNAETAQKMIDNLKALLEDQQKQNAPYDAKVDGRVESAVLETKGDLVIFCVSDDSAKAKQIIKEAFGE